MVLYRRWFDGAEGSESRQLCIPQLFKGDLLNKLHNNCGHLSTHKTTDMVRKNFY